MATTIVTKKGSGAPAASDLVEGELAVDTTNGRLYTENSSAAVVELGSNPSGNITFGDNGKAIFGAGSDLQIYHNGSNSYIQDHGTGDLIIAGTNLSLRNFSTDELFFDGTANGAVRLWYDGSAKLATTSTGIDVTGTATMDGLTVDLADNAGVLLQSPNDSSTAFLKFGDSTSSISGSISYDHYSDALRFKTINTNRMRLDSNGDISFFEDTGTSPKLHWDASAESLGIGTSSPNYSLTSYKIGANANYLQVVNGSSGPNAANGILYGLDGAGNGVINKQGAGDLRTSVNGTERMRIDGATGNVAIGHTAGTAILDVRRGDASGKIAEFHTSTGYGIEIGSSQADAYISSGYAQDLQFKTGNTATTRMTISNAGNVGIGISSLVNPLEVKLTSNTASKTTGSAFDGAAIRLNGELGPSTNSEIAILAGQNDTLSAGIGFLRENSSTWGTALKFYTHPNTFVGTDDLHEVGRWDSAGNLLVGKTASDLTTDGFEVRPTGFVGVRSNGDPLYLNRKSTDGAIATFAKDGTTVGSIGTTGGDLLIGTGNTGLQFYDATPQIIPRNTTGANVDATVDLGASGSRFKDLYLSGGVRGTSTIDITVPETSGGAINLEFGNNVNDTRRTVRAYKDNFDAIVITNTDTTNNGLSIGVDSSENAFFWNGSNTSMNFATNNVERARLTSDGHFLVGKTVSGQVLTKGVELSSSGGVWSCTDTAADSSYFSNIATSGTRYLQRFYAGSTNVGSINSDGTTTTYATSSDQRLKENIVDALSASDDIDAIQVRSFDWKADGSHQKYGMVAQELHSVAPEAVSGDADSEEMMGVDYSKLVPMLIKEIQQLRQRVAQLEE